MQTTTGSLDLLLHHELLLLALRDERGTIASGTWYRYALAGALLAELVLQDRLRLVRKGKKEVAVVADSRPTGEPLMDEVLARVKSSKKPRPLRDWLPKIAGTKALKHRVAASLCERGVLRARERSWLGIFRWKVYPQRDGRTEAALLERLREALFRSSGEVDPRTAVLVSLAHRTGLLTANFEKKELAARADRIERITAGEALGAATKEALDAVRAALVAACVVPAVIH